MLKRWQMHQTSDIRANNAEEPQAVNNEIPGKVSGTVPCATVCP